MRIFSENYLDLCKNLKLTNGGRLQLNNKNYNQINTCSIDYFLIVMHITTTFFRENLTLISPELRICFNNISNFLLSNNWTMARQEWIKLNPNLEKFILNDNCYNWFLSEYNSFVSYYNYYQRYTYTINCTSRIKPYCKNYHRIVIDSSFSLRFVKFYQ
jgi:hypothetical protein